MLVVISRIMSDSVVLWFVWFVYSLNMMLLIGCMKNVMLNVVVVSSSDEYLLEVGKNSLVIMIVMKLNIVKLYYLSVLLIMVVVIVCWFSVCLGWIVFVEFVIVVMCVLFL